MTDILIQILLVLAIVAVGILIVVLWRWNTALIDVNEATKIIKKRAHDVDTWLSQAEATIKDFANSFKSFLNTFEQLKNIKNKMSAFLEPNTENTNKSEKSEDKKEQ